MGEESKFFENGFVRIEESDFKSRMSSIRCAVPNCLLQAVCPVLLGAGHIDELVIHEPISIWVPKISINRIEERFRPHISSEEFNHAVRNSVVDLLKIFQDFSKIITDVSDLIPILPMGVYISFRYRVRVDSILNIMVELQSEKTQGVPEFQFAMASVLSQVLQDFERVAPLASLP